MSVRFAVYLSLFSLILSPIAQAKSGGPKVAPAEPGSICPARQLAIHDCRLNLKNYTVQVTSAKVLLNDGVWRGVENMPLPGEQIEWERLRLSQIGTRWLLEMWLWDVGKGETPIDSLRWIVGELRGPAYQVILDRVVQKRTRVQKESEAPSFLKDKREEHGLKLVGAQLQWQVGRHSGTL